VREDKLETGYIWDTGLIREINEDSILCTSFDLKTHLGIICAGLFAVADGMGGHSAGEVASNLAVKTLQVTCISRLFEGSPVPPLSILSDAFDLANREIMESAGDRALIGMGTTLTATLVMGADLYVAHVGDSRCYIINDRETLQVTKDHSVVQQLVDTGTIAAEAALNHPRRHEITRALGFSARMIPDLQDIKLYAGDNILLCSDGLSSVLTSQAIRETVLGSSDAGQACHDLAAQANLAGGPDNISAIIVKPANLPSWQALISTQTGIRKA
jgi:serine/threonine protein phosphatase PrpC